MYKIDPWPLDKYLFSPYYGPGIVIGVRDMIVGKTNLLLAINVDGASNMSYT